MVSRSRTMLVRRVVEYSFGGGGGGGGDCCSVGIEEERCDMGWAWGWGLNGEACMS